MFHVAHHVERTLLLELGMAFHIETPFLCAACGIYKSVGGTCDNLHIDTFSVLDMYGRTAINWSGVGQRKTIEFDGSLVGTRHVKLAIG